MFAGCGPGARADRLKGRPERSPPRVRPGERLRVAASDRLWRAVVVMQKPTAHQPSPWGRDRHSSHPAESGPGRAPTSTPAVSHTGQDGCGPAREAVARRLIVVVTVTIVAAGFLPQSSSAFKEEEIFPRPPGSPALVEVFLEGTEWSPSSGRRGNGPTRWPPVRHRLDGRKSRKRGRSRWAGATTS